jgi:hypothetical protein
MEETMTEKPRLKYEWIDRLKLRDLEDWEIITGESWEEYNRYGGAPVYRDGVPLKVDGEIVRRNNMTCTIAFMFILERVENPDITLEEIRDLPLDELTKLYKSLSEYLTKMVADVAPKSEVKEGNKTKKPRNDKA